MAPPDIILFHYRSSPYAQRVVWYLNLRRIPYLQCLQPVMLPRPDLQATGTNYRRIPVVAIGRDIYNDTRLILRKLESLYPASATHPPLSHAAAAAYERLFDAWITDGGIFGRISQALPSSLPMVQDPRFQKDRQDLTGSSWDKATMDRNRPETLVEIRGAIEFLEGSLLADGREWILGGEGPTLADLEAIWPFHWISGIPGALPAHLISADHFPRVYAWMSRFGGAVSVAATRAGRPTSLTGAEALQRIEGSDFAEPPAPSVDATCLGARRLS